ncbi:hypothetical protein H2201_004089 [Coniosporium apollinis]|uniref:Poly(A) RNA polymerase mitochondrial-like central palm domain-containing protein n=1 Tax=Coniosporium apollinis TaxID=61459 RepID=A0ABQ9NXL8_9PEZI|nr:hypothetical protein H2201_004089 [Coniosporium apollinis]
MAGKQYERFGQPPSSRPLLVSHHSNSVPSTPVQLARDFEYRSRSPSPHDGLGSHSPRSVSSEANGKLPSLRKPHGGCRFETSAAFGRRRIPYDIGEEMLEKEEEEPKAALEPAEESKLSGDMRELYDQLLPSPESDGRRKVFVKKLERILREEWPGTDFQVHVFGSSGNLLCTSDSDVDICIQTPMKKLETVHMLAEALAKHGMEKVVCVPSAKVPIVKIWDPELRLACDMNVNNTLALENTRMIKTYVQIDDRVRPLAMIIKYWTSRRILNDAVLGPEYFARGDIHNQLYQQYQLLERQKAQLLAHTQAHAQATSQGLPWHSNTTNGSPQKTPYLNGHAGLHALDNPPATAPLVPGFLYHYPAVFEQAQSTSESSSREGVRTNPSSPAIAASVPLRRVPHRSSMATESPSASIRSQSQPARTIVGHLVAEGYPSVPVYDSTVMAGYPTAGSYQEAHTAQSNVDIAQNAASNYPVVSPVGDYVLDGRVSKENFKISVTTRTLSILLDGQFLCTVAATGVATKRSSRLRPAETTTGESFDVLALGLEQQPPSNGDSMYRQIPTQGVRNEAIGYSPVKATQPDIFSSIGHRDRFPALTEALLLDAPSRAEHDDSRYQENLSPKSRHQSGWPANLSREISAKPLDLSKNSVAASNDGPSTDIPLLSPVIETQTPPPTANRKFEESTERTMNRPNLSSSMPNGIETNPLPKLPLKREDVALDPNQPKKDWPLPDNKSSKDNASAASHINGWEKPKTSRKGGRKRASSGANRTAAEIKPRGQTMPTNEAERKGG